VCAFYFIQIADTVTCVCMVSVECLCNVSVVSSSVSLMYVYNVLGALPFILIGDFHSCCVSYVVFVKLNSF
jgi:hypothetical protein